MSLPSLAMPAVTMAICSGEAATSNWPMELCANCASVRFCGNLDAAEDTSELTTLPNPNRSA